MAHAHWRIWPSAYPLNDLRETDRDEPEYGYLLPNKNRVGSTRYV
jgi:hypothetical protein